MFGDAPGAMHLDVNWGSTILIGDSSSTVPNRRVWTRAKIPALELSTLSLTTWLLNLRKA